KEGQPILAGRVTVAGSGLTALTNVRGEFALDSLPAGTQSLEVRKLGYGLTEQAVELANDASVAVTVTMAPYSLPAVTIAAQRDQALADLGYTYRKRAMIGFFLDGDKLRATAPHFSDMVRSATAIKFMPTADGHTKMVSSRDPN